MNTDVNTAAVNNNTANNTAINNTAAPRSWVRLYTPTWEGEECGAVGIFVIDEAIPREMEGDVLHLTTFKCTPGYGPGVFTGASVSVDYSTDTDAYHAEAWWLADPSGSARLAHRFASREEAEAWCIRTLQHLLAEEVGNPYGGSYKPPTWEANEPHVVPPTPPRPLVAYKVGDAVEVEVRPQRPDQAPFRAQGCVAEVRRAPSWAGGALTYVVRDAQGMFLGDYARKGITLLPGSGQESK